MKYIFITFIGIIITLFVGFFALDKYSYQGEQIQMSNNHEQEVSISEHAEFSYPSDLATVYMHTLDWPPQVQVLDEEFSCTEAGKEILRAGKTEIIEVNGSTYCRTTLSEGAAGSIYTQYAYAAKKDSKTVILTFSIQATQCANYDNPQKTACETERTGFDPDALVDRMFSTLTLIPTN